MFTLCLADDGARSTLSKTNKFAVHGAPHTMHFLNFEPNVSWVQSENVEIYKMSCRDTRGVRASEARL